MQAGKVDFPKILFVNEYPPDSLLVADLVRQLLLGYPAERIAWWHWRSGSGRELSDLRVGSTHRWHLPEKLVPNRKLTSLKCSILERICVPLAARHLRQTITEVKPDLVWVLLFGWPILVAAKAGLRNGPRLHVSLWDMPDTVVWKNTLGVSRSHRFDEALFQLIKQADSCDGISKAVLEEIASRTGRKDAIHVHSGFEPQQLRALETPSPVPDDNVLRVAYVGTIISEKSFIEMLAVLDQLRKTLTRRLVLEFFGARNYRSRSWFNPEWMVEHGVFSDSGLVESLQRCTWGIVVMDPEEADLQYSRFSFPNKVGTYLSAGVPVLGIGHERSTLAEVMRRHKLGRFTSATTRDGLGKFLTECLQMPQPRAVFHQDILQCARTEFAAELIRRRLWQAWGAKL